MDPVGLICIKKLRKRLKRYEAKGHITNDQADLKKHQILEAKNIIMKIKL